VPVVVDIRGRGTTLSSVSFDGRPIPSAIVPDNVKHLRRIDVRLGMARTPYLSSANALVISPVYDRATKKLDFDLEAFEGHFIEVEIVSPTASQSIAINGINTLTGITESQTDQIYKIHLQHVAALKRNHYSIKFK
jgi:hypothetical protein